MKMEPFPNAESEKTKKEKIRDLDPNHRTKEDEPTKRDFFRDASKEASDESVS